MDIAFIAPKKLMGQFSSRGDIQLTLSHLLDDPEYEIETKKLELPIRLDNGLFENGHPEKIESVIEKAQRIGATHFFAPDVMFNRKKTEANARKAIKLAKGTGLKVAAVVQADNSKDFIESYQTFVNMKGIDLIGLSILSIPESFHELTETYDIMINRRRCLQELNHLEEHKDSHLLGAGSSYADMRYASLYCPWVVSHDSSSAVWNAIQGHRINPITLEVMGGKTKVPVDFDWNEELTPEMEALIEDNISVVLGACH